MRIEVIGNAMLYLGDCREILPSLRTDIVITDPVWPNAPEHMFPGIEPEKLLKEALRAAKPRKRAVIVLRSDSDPRFLRAVPRRLPFYMSQWLEYALPNYIGRVLGGNEIAYCFGEPAASVQGRRVIPSRGPRVQTSRSKGERDIGHPCSRSWEHFEWLMRWHSDAGDIVTDPFMGSATTGVAALRAGRKFIGMEIEPKYFDIACQRLEGVIKQERLFA